MLKLFLEVQIAYRAVLLGSSQFIDVSQFSCVLKNSSVFQQILKQGAFGYRFAEILNQED